MQFKSLITISYHEIAPSPVSYIEDVTHQTNPESDTLTWNVTGRSDKFLISYSPTEPNSPVEVTDLNYTFTDLTPGTTHNITFVTVGSDSNQSIEATKEVMCELQESLCLTFFQEFHQLRDYKIYSVYLTM